MIKIQPILDQNMSRLSLDYFFKIDLEATMAHFELRIGKIFTIFDIILARNKIQICR